MTRQEDKRTETATDPRIAGDLVALGIAAGAIIGGVVNNDPVVAQVGRAAGVAALLDILRLEAESKVKK